MLEALAELGFCAAYAVVVMGGTILVGAVRDWIKR